VDDPPGARPLSDERLAIPADLEATLVLVRHGESELIVERRFQGRLETPLSATGRRQAALVAARLARPAARPALPVPAGRPLAIVHSPLARTAQTAAAIAEALGHGVPVRPDPAFLEIGQGEWEGRLASEIQATDGDRLAGWRRNPTATWAPGGEPLTVVRGRAIPGLGAIREELAAAGPRGSILAPQVSGYHDHDAPREQPWTIVVAHDGVFKVALCALFDVPLERFWMWTAELCGVSVIEFRAGRPVVRAMNLTEHLAPLRDETAVEEAEERSRSGAL